MNPNINYELWFIITYQYWFIHCNKYITPKQDTNNRRNLWEESAVLWELSVLSAQFFYKPNAALRNKV